MERSHFASDTDKFKNGKNKLSEHNNPLNFYTIMYFELIDINEKQAQRQLLPKVSGPNGTYIVSYIEMRVS